MYKRQAQYFAAKAAVGFAAKMKHALFAHIQGLSFTEMDTIGTSTSVSYTHLKGCFDRMILPGILCPLK